MNAAFSCETTMQQTHPPCRRKGDPISKYKSHESRQGWKLGMTVLVRASSNLRDRTEVSHSQWLANLGRAVETVANRQRREHEGRIIFIAENRNQERTSKDRTEWKGACYYDLLSV
jgi:hypothetical protein